MGILSKYLPDTHLNLPIKPPKSYFRNLIRHYASFLKIFSTKIIRDILYYHAKYQSIWTIGTEVMASFLFLELRQSRTLVFDVLHFCSSFLIARESSKNKAPQAIKDITTASMARNLSFSLLQLGLATLTSTAGQRLGHVVESI